MRSGFLFIGVFLAVACLLLETGCSRKKVVTPFEASLAEGDTHFRAGEFQKADRAYKIALSQSPENPRVLVRLGRLAYRQGRILSGYILMHGTIGKLADESEFQLEYALANHALARSTEARAIARKILEREPANEEALILLAETGVTTRDSQEARRIIEQARAQQPGQAVFEVALGILHSAQTEEAEAEKAFRRALELDPKSAAAHSQLGSLLLRKGDSSAGTAELKAAAELSPLRSPRRIKYADHLMQSGANDEAWRELELITKQAPDYMPAWTQIMRLAFQMARYDESLAAADKVIAVDRTNYDAWMQRVAVKLLRGDLDDVIGDLKKVEEVYNKSPEVKYQLALVFSQKAEYYQAEQHLQQALRLAPSYDEATLLMAEIQLRKGNTSAATVGLRQFLKRRPQSTQAHILLAQAHRADQESAQALTVLQSLAEIFPNHPDAHYLVGLTLLELDRRGEARAAFEKALTLSGRYWPALEMLCELDLAEKRAPQATARLEQLLAKFPDAVPLWLLRAKTRVALNDPAGAEADLHKAIAMDPAAAYPYVLLSRIYLYTGRLEQSLEKLTVLSAQQPSANLWMQIGMLQAMLQQYEAARASYEKVLTLDPRFAPALNNLALLSADHFGQVEKAQDYIRKAREISPNDPVLADTAGWILIHRGQYESALRLLQSAAERLPGDPEAAHHLGMAHYYLGQDELARLAFRKVLAAASNSPTKAAASTRLAILEIDPHRANAADVTRLEEALRTDPNDPVALVRLGAVKLRDNRPDAAAADFERTLTLHPRNTVALTALAELYFGPLAKPERAREIAKQAREAAPTDGQLAWKLGRLLFEAGEHTWAHGLLQDAARSVSHDPEVLHDLARAHYSIGRVAEAETALQAYLAAGTRGTARPSAQRMATLLAATLQPAPPTETVASARRLLEQESDYVPALQVSAIGHMQEKKPEEAIRSFERILALYPQFFPAMRQLAVIYGEQLGNDDKADEWARKTLKLVPDDPESAYQIGVVSFRRGNYEEAVKFLGQSIRRRDDRAEAHFFLGMAYFNLRNGIECGNALQRALQLKLPPQETNEARRVLDQLARRRGRL